jgi:hypothetical protein
MENQLNINEPINGEERLEEKINELDTMVDDNIDKKCDCEKDNMHIWNQVCKTNPAYTKNVEKGSYKYTAVCAQHQRKRATELWGPFGQGWGIKNVNFNFIDNGTKALYTAILYYPNGEFPINSSISLYLQRKEYKNGSFTGNYTQIFDEEWSKKVSTDALTKALSYLGFNSDIFEGKFDDNKYVAELKKEIQNITQELRDIYKTVSPEYQEKIKNCDKNNLDDMKKLLNEIKK